MEVKRNIDVLLLCFSFFYVCHSGFCQGYFLLLHFIPNKNMSWKEIICGSNILYITIIIHNKNKSLLPTIKFVRKSFLWHRILMGILGFTISIVIVWFSLLTLYSYDFVLLLWIEAATVYNFVAFWLLIIFFPEYTK